MELLFEKLTKRPANQQQSAAQNPAQLQKSVATEIARILSARSYYNDTENNRQDILSYGIPRVTDCNTANTEDINKLRRSIEKAIRQFEPRLQRATVSVVESSDPTAFNTVTLKISGLLQLENQQDHIVFKMTPELSLV